MGSGEEREELDVDVTETVTREVHFTEGQDDSPEDHRSTPGSPPPTIHPTVDPGMPAASRVLLTVSQAIQAAADRADATNAPGWNIAMDAPPWSLHTATELQRRSTNFMGAALALVGVALVLAWRLVTVLDHGSAALQTSTTSGAHQTTIVGFSASVQQVLTAGAWLAVGLLILAAVAASYRGSQIGLLRISASVTGSGPGGSGDGTSSNAATAQASASGASSSTAAAAGAGAGAGAGKGVLSKEPVLVAGSIQAAVSVGIAFANLSAGQTAAILALSAALLAVVTRSQVTPNVAPKTSDGTPLTPAPPGGSPAS